MEYGIGAAVGLLFIIWLVYRSKAKQRHLETLKREHAARKDRIDQFNKEVEQITKGKAV